MKLTSQRIVFAIALMVHIVGSHVSTDLVVFITVLQLLAFRVLVVFQVYGVEWQTESLHSVPVVIGCPFFAQYLLMQTNLISFLLFLHLILDDFPSLALPLQILQPLFLNFSLLFQPLLFPSLSVCCRKVLLKSLQSFIRILSLQSI